MVRIHLAIHLVLGDVSRLLEEMKDECIDCVFDKETDVLTCHPCDAELAMEILHADGYEPSVCRN